MLQATRSFVTTARPALLSRWLLLIAGLVIAMVVVGGVTRLTESGLSITEWKPISGVIPPLTDAQWQAEFARYRETVQYRQLNQGMTLGAFKAIFFWEYLHRELGRLIGLAAALPLAWFAIRRRIPAGYGWRLTALLALIGLQGTLGWVMVSKGLWSGDKVPAGWLALHLVTALFTLAGFVWTALDLRALSRGPIAAPARPTGIGVAAVGLLFVQLAYGALTAGLRAGLVTNEWPLMNGRLFPGEVLGARPLPALLTGDPSLVHFVHRWFAFVAAGALVVLAWRAMKAGAWAPARALVLLVALQIALGISTVLSGVQIGVAVAHQANAALLVVAAVAAAHAIGRRTP